MKAMLNLSLALMIAAAAFGSADFIGMYRSGEIDNIYTHESTPEVVPHSIPVTLLEKEPVTQTTAGVCEIKEEPLSPNHLTVSKKEVENKLTASVISTRDIITTSDVTIDEPVVTEKVIHTTTTVADPVSISDNNSSVAKDLKKVYKKKFKLSMYSRAMPRQYEYVLADEKPDSSKSKENIWDY